MATVAAGSPSRPLICLPGLPATIDPQPIIAQMVSRASCFGFPRWWRRAQSVGFCAAPIQLVGTDQFGRQRVVWTRCNNRRASVCPSCSDLYARDTWQLVAAGTTGNRHGVPAEIATRPQVFTTLTAPSYGAVHNHTGHSCRAPRCVGGYRRCAHGKPLWCNTTHNPDDPVVGQPLCGDCYDYLGHVLFTWHLPELWRRFTIALCRALTAHLKTIGAEPKSVRVSFVKVVEMQARAIPHIHALIRLDPADTTIRTTATGEQHRHGPAATRGGGEPRHGTSPGWESPVTAAALAVLIQRAARAVSLDVPDLATETPGEAPSLTIRFGSQIDTQPIATETRSAPTLLGSQPAQMLSPRRVAGYLAKYVTKSLADFGISARRLSAEAITTLEVSEHVRAILITIADLADRARRHQLPALAGMGRWLHTLGYRGHITTKSRRYSTSMGKLRAIRADWTRQHADANIAKDTALQENSVNLAESGGESLWEFDRAGLTTPGDRSLIVSAALRHINTRRTGLAESRRQMTREVTT